MVMDFIRRFLKDLVESISPSVGIPDFSDRPLFWSKKNEGSLFLSIDTLREFEEVRDKLLSKFAPREDLSESAIDSALRTAVFEVVDIPKRREQNLSVRLDNALKKLEEFLTTPPEKYKCWIEVAGLEEASLPACFGAIRFSVFGVDEIQDIKTIIESRQVNKPKEGSRDRSGLNELLEPFPGVTTAEVEVNARDAKAAEILAERRIQATIECVNFFSDMMPGPLAWLSLPGRQEQQSSSALLAVSSSGSIHQHFDRTGPIGELSIAGLLGTDGVILNSVKRVDSLLMKQPNKVEEMILTAVRWGGRATVAKTLEESFLLFAIALECLILPKQSEELTYRLSQRVARLLGENADERVKLAKRTKDLYGTRSKIVHSGHYEVTEEECNEIRSIVKTVICELLTNSDVEQCGTPDKLHDYFEELTLS